MGTPGAARGWRGAELIAPGRAHPLNWMAAPRVPAAITVDLVRCRQPQRSQEAGMAQKITLELQDDLDGGPADETVRFGVDSTEYEFDLSKKNAAAFRKKLAPFIDHARKARRGQRRPPGGDRSLGGTGRIP